MSEIVPFHWFKNNWQKYGHLVLVNHLGGLNLTRNCVVRLTDCPDMTIAVYHRRKATTLTQVPRTDLPAAASCWRFLGWTRNMPLTIIHIPCNLEIHSNLEISTKSGKVIQVKHSAPHWLDIFTTIIVCYLALSEFCWKEMAFFPTEAITVTLIDCHVDMQISCNSPQTISGKH